MLSQENLYQLILKEHWTEILDALYTDRHDIGTDALLQKAATIFENEFFKKVKDYPKERKDIEDNLDSLYILHHGKFYQVSSDNYKTLIIELVKRKPLKEAYNFANIFPKEEICKETIDRFNELKAKEKGFKLESARNIPMNWIEIYNRLFELINNQGDTATYYSGSRFINTVREFEPYFPDYNQFISQRNQEGKSTSRKIFYYDILLGLKDETRIKVVNRILEIIKPFQSEKVNQIEELLGKKKITTEPTVIPKTEKEKEEEKSSNPVVFISYSWDNEAHKEWVLTLANQLCKDGVDVILDRYYLKPGKSLPHFVEESISKANRIVIIFTPNYKLKADKRAGGVGYEYSIMNADLYRNQTTNEKIIPVLRDGNMEESIPTFMQQFIHIDTRNDDNAENSYVDLLREIYNEPAIQKPKLGAKPIFEKTLNETIEKPAIGNKPVRFINPDILDKLKFNDTPILTLLDGRKINAGTIRIEDNYLIHYTGKGLREIFRPGMTDDEKSVSDELKKQTEEYLIENGYITRTPLDTIVDVNR
jgi:hypothetical protein